jgi:hypothetical protein
MQAKQVLLLLLALLLRPLLQRTLGSSPPGRGPSPCRYGRFERFLPSSLFLTSCAPIELRAELSLSCVLPPMPPFLLVADWVARKWRPRGVRQVPRGSLGVQLELYTESERLESGLDPVEPQDDTITRAWSNLR